MWRKHSIRLGKAKNDTGIRTGVLILKWTVFPPCLCHLQTLEKTKPNYILIWRARRSSGFLCGYTQLRITRSDWEQSWPFPIAAHTYTMAVQSLTIDRHRWDEAAKSCQREGTAIIPQRQWQFWGTRTHCRTSYKLVPILHWNTLRGFREHHGSFLACTIAYPWVLSSTK